MAGFHDTILPVVRLGGTLENMADMMRPNTFPDSNGIGARRMSSMVMHQGELWVAHIDNLWTEADRFEYLDTASPPPHDALYVDQWNGYSWFNMGGEIDPPVDYGTFTPGARWGPTRCHLASDGTDIYLAYVTHVGGYAYSGTGGPYVQMNTPVIRRWNGSSWELVKQFVPPTYNQGAPFGGAALPFYGAQVVCLASSDFPGEPCVMWSESGSTYNGTGTPGATINAVYTGEADGTIHSPVDGFRYEFEARWDREHPYIFTTSSLGFPHNVVKMYDGFTGAVLQVADSDLITPEFTFFAAEGASNGSGSVSAPYWDGSRYIYYVMAIWSAKLSTEFESTTSGFLLQVPVDADGPFEVVDDLVLSSRSFENSYFNQSGFLYTANTPCAIFPERDNVWMTQTFGGIESDDRFHTDPVQVHQYDRLCPLDEKLEIWDRIATPGWRMASIDVDPNSTPYFEHGSTTAPPTADPGFSFCDHSAVADLENNVIYVLVLAGTFLGSGGHERPPGTPELYWSHRVYRVPLCRGCAACQVHPGPPILNIQFRAESAE